MTLAAIITTFSGAFVLVLLEDGRGLNSVTSLER